MPLDLRETLRGFFAYLAGPEFQPIVATFGWLALASLTGLSLFFAFKLAYWLLGQAIHSIGRAIRSARRRREYARYVARSRKLTSSRRLPRSPQAVADGLTAPANGRFFQDAPTRSKISRAGWYEPRQQGPRDWSPSEP